MKKPIERRSRDDMRQEYDFASMKGGVRGKYYEQYRKGSNVVLLEPDVAEAFPNEDAVNEALRGILCTTRAVRQSGGLSDRALKLASVMSKRRRSSLALRDDVYSRANGRCECTMTSCGHSGRCGAMLRGEWEVHRIAAGGPYAMSNVKGMCQTCHRNTTS